jgi:hypothetical protein
VEPEERYDLCSFTLRDSGVGTDGTVLLAPAGELSRLVEPVADRPTGSDLVRKHLDGGALAVESTRCQSRWPGSNYRVPAQEAKPPSTRAWPTIAAHGQPALRVTSSAKFAHYLFEHLRYS